MITGNLDDDHRGLAILTISMIIGIMLFIVVSCLVNFFNGAFIKDARMLRSFFIVIMIISLFMIIGARVIFYRKVRALKETQQTMKTKSETFRAITIVHMALCELPAILSLICFMLFGSFLFFIPVAMSLLEMILNFPARGKLEQIVDSGTYNDF